MKKCNVCWKILEDDVYVCPDCGNVIGSREESKLPISNDVEESLVRGEQTIEMSPKSEQAVEISPKSEQKFEMPSQDVQIVKERTMNIQGNIQQEYISKSNILQSDIVEKTKEKLKSVAENEDLKKKIAMSVTGIGGAVVAGAGMSKNIGNGKKVSLLFYRRC